MVPAGETNTIGPPDLASAAGVCPIDLWAKQRHPPPLVEPPRALTMRGVTIPFCTSRGARAGIILESAAANIPDLGVKLPAR